MQITLNLPEDIGQELNALPNADMFVTDLIKAALQCRHFSEKRPLGILKDDLKVEFAEDFKMTDEIFLQS